MTLKGTGPPAGGLQPRRPLHQPAAPLLGVGFLRLVEGLCSSHLCRLVLGAGQALEPWMRTSWAASGGGWSSGWKSGSTRVPR